MGELAHVAPIAHPGDGGAGSCSFYSSPWANVRRKAIAYHIAQAGKARADELSPIAQAEKSRADELSPTRYS